MATSKRPAFPSIFWLLAALPCLLAAQTTVTLTTSPNPSKFGAPVVLTATVTPATASGNVTFYDGVTVLGTKSLVAGVAQISTIALPSGRRMLKAYYAGVTSIIVAQTVQAQPSTGFSATRLSATADNMLAVTDFNGDGKADLATLEIGGSTLTVLLGDGAGNFSGTSTPLSGVYSGQAAAADFNGDGKMDLALAGASGLGILLGNGDGTFQPIVVHSFPYSLSSVVAADFNADGIVDLAVTDGSAVSVLLGKGDGTFQTAVPYSTNPSGGSSEPFFVVAGDFNGDGKADLAVADFTSATVSILLGKGDGTFQTPSRTAIPTAGTLLVTADFNGDGKLDVATSNSDVLLGNGDGTFQAAVNYGVGSNGVVSVGDFNGDGNADLVFAGSAGHGPVSILLGNGDGTFQPLVTYPFATDNSAMMVGDFNSDGKTDIAFRNVNIITLLGTTVTVTPNASTLSALPNTAFPTLQVTVKDGANPLSGVTVTFTAPSSGASAVLSSSTAVTDINGVASVTATANAITGQYQVFASALGVYTFFTLNNQSTAPPPQPNSATATGTPQQTPLGTAFPKPLQVTLLTALLEPLPGVTVTFTAPSSGPSAVLSSSTVVSNASGVASVTATANNIPGTYSVTALSGGIKITFTLTNLQPAAVTLASSANPATFGAPLTLTATVVDASPTGRLTFFDGVAILGVKPVSSGTATLSTALLAAGGHKLTAFYYDGVSFVAGTSNAVTETVKAVAGGALAAQPPMSIPATSSSVVADFNSDGKADLATPGQDIGSWWQVDLGASATIGSIAIWNRTDCCGSRLTDYWVFASNTPFNAADTPATLQNRAGTFSSHQTTAPSPSFTIPVNGAAGRYVRVQLSTPGYLSLAEVQVFGAGAQAGVNLALGKAATQSSTYPGYPGDGAASAVDGNTDGNFLDGSVTSTSLNVVYISLGNGDGTFQPPVVYGAASGVMASGDFNGHGITDLALYDNVNATILLGNGDGTFRPATTYPVNTPVTPGGANFAVSYSGIVVGDFNGDGKADIVAGFSYYCCGPLLGNWSFPAYLLPGNGDGTFGAPILYGAVPPPYAMADFNGDGKPDLAGGGFSQIFLPVILGNGNGTGSPVVSEPRLGSTAFPGLGITMLTGDFNGDGKVDLVTGGTIYLGNGDGTFQALGLPGVVAAVATGDFNGDGILDLIVSNSSGGGTVILLGNGDGTFRQGFAIQTGLALAVADFNGDGRADVLAESPGGVTVLLGVTSATFTVTAIGGTPQTAGVGAAFALPLQVTVLNNGIPVSGVTVAFSAPSVGASAILASPTAVTNAAGVASVTAVANSVPGSYTVTATVNGTTATFSLSNQALAFLLATGGTPQSTTVGTPFPVALQATVQFSNGLPASGVNVTFTVPIVGASATFGGATALSAVTNAAGVASVMATANLIAGSYRVTAVTGALSTSFVLTNVSTVSGNLAQGKAATQSSTLPGYPSATASSAVDGNTDGNFFDGSVTATNPDANPWWQVDLGASAAVSSIVIWNRTDCCASRLSDYWVFVSDTPFLASDTSATLQNRAGTFASHQTAAPNPSTTIAGAAEGRYVRVQLSSAGYLSLAEVQVFGTGGAPPPSDLAQGKPATQSSTFSGIAPAAAGSAVDGNTDGNFSDGSVTATNADANAWWQVDLGVPASVSSIAIWNRTDCCAGRLSDYWVFVSNTPFLPTDSPANLQNRAGTFASHQTTAPNPSTTITVNAQGQYVRVQLSDTDYLSLAEVQVFGTGGSPISNLAVGKTATQSSTLPGYATDGAPMAVDGNIDGNFFDGSVTATGLDPNPWWQVDLGAQATVSSIMIWNRTDCCASRLSDYWVFVSNTPFLATDTPATLMNRAGMFAIHQTTAPNPSITIPVGAQGQYVRVQLSSAGYLSLAEVQVFGQ